MDIFNIPLSALSIPENVPTILRTATGVLKIPGYFHEVKGSFRRFQPLVVCNPEGPHIIFMRPDNLEATCKYVIGHIDRAAAIDTIKKAIANTWQRREKIKGAHPMFGQIRKLFFDAILHTRAFMCELMEHESQERFVSICAAKIQTAFKKAVTDPAHPICKRRLMYEYQSLVVY